VQLSLTLPFEGYFLDTPEENPAPFFYTSADWAYCDKLFGTPALPE
jgi:hypothetical protein